MTLDTDRLDWLLLGLLLHEAYEHPLSGSVSVREFRKTVPPEISDSEIIRRLTVFEEHGVASGANLSMADKYEHMYCITPKGVFFILSCSGTVYESAYGFIYDFPDEISDTIEKILSLEDLYDETLMDAFGNPFVLEASALAAPAAGRYVEFDHNSRVYLDAVEAIDDVLAEVRSSNAYRNQDPRDQERQIAELSAFRTLLQSVRVSISAATRFVIPTLKYLAAKFGDSAIGAAATAAIAAVLKLFGLL